MTVRNLERLFSPASVALIGASDQRASVGAVVGRNLRAGFAGPIMLVNPNHAKIDGEICHPDVASLPAAPDLAIVATPPDATSSAEMRWNGLRCETFQREAPSAAGSASGEASEKSVTKIPSRRSFARALRELSTSRWPRAALPEAVTPLYA